MFQIPFDVYTLYAYTGLFCAFIIAIILNRTLTTAFKQSVDKHLVRVFIFFIIFCLIDAIWGLIGFTVYDEAPLVYEISTYLFHIFAALSSIVISIYAVHYFKIKAPYKTYIDIYRLVIFVIQIGVIITNIIMKFAGSKFWFYIDNEGYHTVKLGIGDITNLGYIIRYCVFALQFLQYVPFIVFALIKGFKNLKAPEFQGKRGIRYISGAFFLAIPLVFGTLQMLYPDGPMYSFGFAIFSIAIYSINVTRQREEFLKEYHEVSAAQEANTAKQNFLANMSHDIRTPINGIMGLTNLAKDEKDPEKIHDYIDKIDKSSQHLLSLVNDVLDMTRMENMQESLLNEDKIDIRTVVDNIKSIIGGQLVNSNVDFNVEFVPEPTNPFIIGDELRLKQIMINILGNSVKFTQEGSINLKIIENTPVDGFVKYDFLFEDTGIGMSREFMKVIFEPFSQEKKGARSNYQGTGLGMSIVAQLVKLMKGTISVDSELGKGSQFIVSIPFKISEQKEIKTVEPTNNFSMEGIKVLLVEDNELNMEIAETILGQYGAIVTTATDGQIALDTFAQNKPDTFDIILMDIMMPNMNGYEATEAIRKLDREDAKIIPIIAMTANAFDEDKKKALASGMNGHIAKPIDFKALLSEVSKNLRR